MAAFAVLAMAGCQLAGMSSARAQTCSQTTAPASYGAVNVLSGASATTTGAFTITCSGTKGKVIRVCVEWGQGNNYNGVASPRSLVGSAAGLTHEIYTNAAHSQVWGAWGTVMAAYGTAGAQVDLTVPASGTVSTTMTAYGVIAPNQPTVPPGSYTWTTASPAIFWAYQGAAACPLAVNNGIANATGATVWTAIVQAYCSVSATPLNFGSVGVLSGAVTGSSQMSVTCTRTTPYTIALDGGLSGAASPTARKMIKGAESIVYGLYSDAAMAVPFGAASGATVSGVGTGLTQTVRVYGKVAVQTTPSPGVYSDTVVVSITY